MKNLFNDKKGRRAGGKEGKKRRKEKERKGHYENIVKIVSVLVPFRIAISRETTLSK